MKLREINPSILTADQLFSTNFFSLFKPCSICGPYCFSNSRLENFSQGYQPSLKSIYHWSEIPFTLSPGIIFQPVVITCLAEPVDCATTALSFIAVIISPCPLFLLAIIPCGFPSTIIKVEESVPGYQFFQFGGWAICSITFSFVARILTALEIRIWEGMNNEITVISRKRKTKLMIASLISFTVEIVLII